MYAAAKSLTLIYTTFQVLLSRLDSSVARASFKGPWLQCNSTDVWFVSQERDMSSLPLTLWQKVVENLLRKNLGHAIHGQKQKALGYGKKKILPSTPS